MNAWREIQKDLDARKYKSNPFQQKYIDLTTSSLISGDNSHEEISNLEFLSKSIRARSDIISCQIAYLAKEAATVSGITLETKVVEFAGKSVVKKNATVRNDDVRYFIDENAVEESAILKDIHKDPECSGLKIGASTQYLWIDELIKSAEPSLIRKLCRPLSGPTEIMGEEDHSSTTCRSGPLENIGASYLSSDSLISSM